MFIIVSSMHPHRLNLKRIDFEVEKLFRLVEESQCFNESILSLNPKSYIQKTDFIHTEIYYSVYIIALK